MSDVFSDDRMMVCVRVRVGDATGAGQAKWMMLMTPAIAPETGDGKHLGDALQQP